MWHKEKKPPPTEIEGVLLCFSAFRIDFSIRRFRAFALSCDKGGRGGGEKGAGIWRQFCMCASPPHTHRISFPVLYLNAGRWITRVNFHFHLSCYQIWYLERKGVVDRAYSTGLVCANSRNAIFEMRCVWRALTQKNAILGNCRKYRIWNKWKFVFYFNT